MLFGDQYNQNNTTQKSYNRSEIQHATSPGASSTTSIKIKAKSKRKLSLKSNNRPTLPNSKTPADKLNLSQVSSSVSNSNEEASSTNVPEKKTFSTKIQPQEPDPEQQRLDQEDQLNRLYLPESPMYYQVWKNMQFKLPCGSKLSPESVIKPICVTGIDGFVASWIVATLLERGYYVRGTIHENQSDAIVALQQLPGAATHLTIIEASLLTHESCDLAVTGCDYVIHTGTPSSCLVRDPLSEALDPGIHSIGSRMHCIIPMMTNFIQACARAKIQKLILTSSIAAMADSATPEYMIRDTNWNVESTLEKNPHFLSLKLAEEAAWQLVDQLPKASKFDFIVINPGTVMGPVICNNKIPPGNQVIFDLVTGNYSAIVDLNWAMTDVRDCAEAHVLALESVEARGRHICVNQTIWLVDIVSVLSDNGYSGRNLPWQVGLPNWVARLPSYSIQLGQVGASLYAKKNDPSASGKRRRSQQDRAFAIASSAPYINDKITQILGLAFQSPKTTMLDVAETLLKWGLIKPWDEDHEAIVCACCKDPFTFYRRKHHCRECGVIICHACSQSRAKVEGLDEKARLCDTCVKNSVPELIALLKKDSLDGRRKAVVALESLMETMSNHELLTRAGGLPLIMSALHVSDSMVSEHAAKTLLIMSKNTPSALQMILEGAVLQMLEVEEHTSTWNVAMNTLRNLWTQVNRHDFCLMLHAVARVSSDAAIGALRGNILLTFVHMMTLSEVTERLLPEGILVVLLTMLHSSEMYPRCAAAHAIQHLLKPTNYHPDVSIVVEPYIVDNHEELLANSALSDLQFLVKGHIAPINAHKVVLFFRNRFFKNMFGATARNDTDVSIIEIDNCSHQVFTLLLRFLYTGQISIELSFAPELLRAASDYQVVELQQRAEKFLAQEVTVANVVELLYLADSCHAEDLKRVCIAFCLEDIHEIVRTESFYHYRLWASQEVLGALSLVLGSAWEHNFAHVVQEQREGKQDQVVTTDLPDSPLSRSCRYSPRRRMSSKPFSDTTLSSSCYRLKEARLTFSSPSSSSRMVYSPARSGSSVSSFHLPQPAHLHLGAGESPKNLTCSTTPARTDQITETNDDPRSTRSTGSTSTSVVVKPRGWSDDYSDRSEGIC